MTARSSGDRTIGGASSWWLAAPGAVALIAGVAHAVGLARVFTEGFPPWWVVTGVVSLAALLATVVALFRVPGPRPAVVVVAAAGSFVAGGTLLVDAAVVVFLQWVADGLSNPNG
ncbi:hypothetical protein [Curtobacterium sp. YR515]|uniref:hypothetical protein n=1 Tax=Curtobacterium sp. YR515 TaxID=1855316 RepID=UPI0008E88594|nr:hypothetical protein [Curtobacterium sp. YR515]SFF33712.1 hypothetical protein SAMN05216329_0077 [Curtobacterium sp. YR515]